MLLEEALRGQPHRWVRGDGVVEAAGVTHDSRRCAPGMVFVAIRGAKADGVMFAPEAVAKGAAAVVVGAGKADSPELSAARSIIEVEDARTALAVMARNLHGRIDEKLPVVGVTGTNGKTTTTRITATMLEAAGVRTGWLGTVTCFVGDEELPSERTTPEAPDIHRHLSRMEAAGCGACVMEVSSHSLDLRRVHGMRFAAAVFTNLTREHLDWHRDMESYYQAKAGLFEMPREPAAAIINVDDEYGARLDAELRAGSRGRWDKLITYGAHPHAEIRIASLQTSEQGVGLVLEAPEGRFELTSPLLGRFNGWNVTAAAATARAMGIGWDAIIKGAACLRCVPGRMEKVGCQEFTVLVDYAHKEQALKSLLESARELTRGRVIVVFGCGGDRDRTKRSLMGAHAARLAGLVFVTSDNPRSEKPEDIIEEILAGMTEEERSSGRVAVEPDRRKAIVAAIGRARAGDTVVIAGKGHETHQIIGDRVSPFDDRAVAREALQEALGTGGAGGAKGHDA